MTTPKGKWAVWIAALALLALAVTGCGQRSLDVRAETSSAVPAGQDREADAGKPRATTDGVHGTGQAMKVGVPPEALPKVSELAVRASVVRIDQPVLNTADGSWGPKAAESDSALHDVFSELLPYTRVHLRVIEVLGERPESSLTASVGDELTLTLLGGATQITLSPEQAKAIGITVPIEEAEGIPDQTDANQTYPSAPLALTVGMQPAAYLVEGDNVMAFLTGDTIELADGGTDNVIFSLAPEGAGIFRQVDETTFENASSGLAAPAAELLEAANQLSQEAGPPQEGTVGTY